ncbi:MAG: SIS domain-containing protein [Bdellovibrionia bacterium]
MTSVEQAIRSQPEAWRRVVLAQQNKAFALKSPSRIFFFGEGSSTFAAHLTAFSLRRSSVFQQKWGAVPLVSGSSLQMGSEWMPAQGDWVFAWTHRGKTAATLRAAEMAHQRGAEVIWVASEEAPCPSFSPVHLKTCPLEKVEPHTVGLTASVCAVTTFFGGAEMAEHWMKLADLACFDLEELRAQVGSGPQVILGQWEGEWIGREARLKLMEMAGVFPQFFGSEEFFHGPQAALLKNHQFTQGFGASPKPILWYVAHSEDFRQKEIQADCCVQLSRETPVSWVLGLLELQWRSLAVAINLNQDPNRLGKSS